MLEKLIAKKKAVESDIAFHKGAIAKAEEKLCLIDELISEETSEPQVAPVEPAPAETSSADFIREISVGA